MTAAARLQKQAAKHSFLIVEIAEGNKRFPRPVFGCETLAEAIRLCDKMNADAGFAKFIVRGEDDPK